MLENFFTLFSACSRLMAFSVDGQVPANEFPLMRDAACCMFFGVVCANCAKLDFMHSARTVFSLMQRCNHSSASYICSDKLQQYNTLQGLIS